MINNYQPLGEKIMQGGSIFQFQATISRISSCAASRWDFNSWAAMARNEWNAWHHDS